MMKTEWNQKPVKNPVNPGADPAKPDHPFPEGRNHRLNRHTNPKIPAKIMVISAVTIGTSLRPLKTRDIRAASYP